MKCDHCGKTCTLTFMSVFILLFTCESCGITWFAQPGKTHESQA